MGFPCPNEMMKRPGANRGSSNEPSGPVGSPTPRGGSNAALRFNVADLASREQNPTVVAPGKGAVPVMPWNQAGNPASVMPVADMPRR
jgi:hypothetical protein